MPQHTVRDRTLAILVLLGAAAAALVTHAPKAHADGVLSDREAIYVLAYAESAVCPVIDMFPNVAGVTGVMNGIVDDGFTYDSAVDIINASVHEYCPRNWALLQRIGSAARGEQTGQRA
ncbi:hypothetical protein [Mycolicibacterium peregrinum]|uniref:hypothetical protein n=1 Tax=Mycolicibacterium peregrinum TaxID=43304 RepID=UPI003AAE9D42